ncbi:tRNA pseudouridine(13) synthase TruD [Candidatus Poribacteria bacterium]|nr:tRNA pseudouridine(13) synthase TruD [Candidatus Poribacteria bacterium]
MRFEPEDFIVEEIPLYEPTGVGTHTFFAIRKRGLTTFEAIKHIAGVLTVNPNDIGYAGLKDKHALTTQVLSVHGITPERILKIDLSDIEILWASGHGHKLRVGHLRGNRFEIILRDIPLIHIPIIKDRMLRFQSEGVPNRFGDQRFGNKQDTHLIGKALVKKDWKTLVNYIRTDSFPIKAGERLLQDDPDKMEKVIRSIPHRMRRLYLSAYQAYLFNRILDMRLQNLGRLCDGDVAIKHINNAPFLVKDASKEQSRADTFEISPSGPIFGYKMRQPVGKIQEMEDSLLKSEGLRHDAFRKVAGIRLAGTRRPLRMKLEFHKVEKVDEGIRLYFSLPVGCYATVVLSELYNYLDG